MQIPNVAECMVCHSSILTNNAAVQTIARAQKEGRLLQWAPVYKLPDFVFFSHQKHLDAKVQCAVCHGAIGERDALRQEKDTSMVACFNCHKLQKVSTSCGLCHNVGF